MGRTEARIPGRIHAVGAGGAGVSALLRVLAARGVALSGVDAARSEHTDLLNDLGVPVAIDAEGRTALSPGVELVVRSAAIPEDHPHLQEARRRGLPVLKYAELLARVVPSRRTLAVAGTHGKTTTAWMLFHALRGLATRFRLQVADPWAIVGGVCRRVGANAALGQPGGYFAVEACEYDRSFLRLWPEGAIVTNVEADHLDYYGSLDAIERAFARFVHQVHPSGLLVLGRSVPERIAVDARARVWRLGRELEADLLGEERGRFRFRLRGPGWAAPPVTLAVPGAFNVENAALALALAVGLAGGRLDPAAAAQAAAAGLAEFRGARRRFEPWGGTPQVEIVHDYAHHPTELAATLEAARRVYPRRAQVVLFQPHQHSRTARFLDDFVQALLGADRVVVADVYGARAHIDRVTAGAPELVAELRRRGVDAREGGDLGTSVERTLERLPDRCVLLVVGAGDVENVRAKLLAGLAARAPARR